MNPTEQQKHTPFVTCPICGAACTVTGEVEPEYFNVSTDLEKAFLKEQNAKLVEALKECLDELQAHRNDDQGLKVISKCKELLK